MIPEELKRCAWTSATDMLYRKYHDEEWGQPVHDDRLLFEFLILEGFQAGLSWYTILKKRNRFRDVFDGFDPVKIAAYDDRKISELMADPGIVRNRLKINAAIGNAVSFLAVQKKSGSFDTFLWSFVGGRPRINAWKTINEVPCETPESAAMSKALKSHGFRFVGPTICYAFMQAVGMVNDHTTDCFRYAELTV